MNPIIRIPPERFALLSQRLDAMRHAAAPGALLSISLALDGDAQWLALAPETGDYCYWARPADGLFQLGLGRAVVCTSAGPARFTALQAAYNGIAADWRHDDIDGTGLVPRASVGFAFDEETADGLPNAQLAVPAVALRSDGGRGAITFTTPAREVALAPARWQALLAGRHCRWRRMDTAHRDEALPMRAGRARVNATLAEIAARRIDKVVLSRNVRLSLPADTLAADAFALLPTLAGRHATSTVFACGHAGNLFLGATPERLVRLDAGIARADALAGTAWAGRSLAGSKDAGEQRIVLDAVREALATLCDDVTHPEAPSEIALRHVRHLWTPVEGRVRSGIGLFDLLAALHPTPAVGGWPRDAALEWLHRAGERRPGWYAGGIGWIDAAGNGDIAVALRCALFSGRQAVLSAGAGIVPGSVAELECAETDAKRATLLDVLGGESTQERRTGT